MRNKINDIGLVLLAPTKNNDGEPILWSNAYDELKIIEIDILYKESDKNNVYVVDTLLREDFNSVEEETLTYNYQSKKAWKTIPTDQVTRVSDAVPLRAKSQEVTGNRVLYGNYIDKHTSPARLSYHLTIGDKPILPEFGDDEDELNDPVLYLRKEYQNHTLKQNRTYQVGVLLADRYGRQSNVILSDFVIGSGIAKNSTIFHNYKNKESTIITDQYTIIDGQGNPIPATTWPGDALNIVFKNIIPTLPDNSGYPGVYGVADGTISNVLFDQIDGLPALPANCDKGEMRIVSPNNTDIYADIQVTTDSQGKITDTLLTFSTDGWTCGQEFVLEGNAVTRSNAGSGVVKRRSGGSGGCDFTGFGITGNVQCNPHNPLGWHSWRVVVKQTEQEYYNVYLPTVLAGYPCNQNVEGYSFPSESEWASQSIPRLVYPTGQEETTSHLVLFGDNINKIPKDLNDVGPEQKEFRSSTRLYKRVDSAFTVSYTHLTLPTTPYV